MNDEEIRRNFLGDILARKEKHQEPLHIAPEYAQHFKVSVEAAEANIEYMFKRGWIRGATTDMYGKTIIVVQGIYQLGLDHLKGIVTTPPTMTPGTNFIGNQIGQFAWGNNNFQNQTVNIFSFNGLYTYIETYLDKSQSTELRPVLEELEEEVKAGSVAIETLKEIGTKVAKYGPKAAPVIEIVAHLLGLKP